MKPEELRSSETGSKPYSRSFGDFGSVGEGEQLAIELTT
jgi:hypothetical protein